MNENYKFEAKPKPLLPSLRPKKRYVVFEIISQEPVEFLDFNKSFWNAMLEFLGELGVADARISILKNLYDLKTQRGVIRCAHDMVEKIRVTLSLIHMIGESRTIIHVIGVTGTIKSAQNKYLKMPSIAAYEKE